MPTIRRCEEEASKMERTGTEAAVNGAVSIKQLEGRKQEDIRAPIDRPLIHGHTFPQHYLLTSTNRDKVLCK